MYEPEEAALAAKMPGRPARLETVAKRVGLEPDELQRRLEPMCDKGLVMDLVHPVTGVTRYMLAPPVIGFFEFSMMRVSDGIPKQRMAKALHAYTHGDRAFADEVFSKETTIGRTMVREDQIAEDARPDVLDWERATAIVKGARSHAVSYCYCRHKAEHLDERCDAPIDVCLSLDAGADYIIQRSFGRAISGDEAMDVLHTAKKAGLVQIADNVLNRPTYICNCCGCCCGQLQSINQYDLNGVNPSGFQPESDADKCIGCALCSRMCPVTAISMVADRVGAKRRNALHPQLDADRCIGCGVCAAACRKEAMWMVRGGDRRHIPLNSVERAVRMSLERGRLAHLVADQGASRGHQFLNQVIQAMMSLPAAGRLAASQQVKSRFVRYALKNVRDPTGGDNRPAA
jgi:Pyruvate/2-oxoacid:ferredoxin oxidoreductase delta subunit